jgi:hypothetical protein
LPLSRSASVMLAPLKLAPSASALKNDTPAASRHTHTHKCYSGGQEPACALSVSLLENHTACSLNLGTCQKNPQQLPFS